MEEMQKSNFPEPVNVKIRVDVASATSTTTGCKWSPFQNWWYTHQNRNLFFAIAVSGIVISGIVIVISGVVRYLTHYAKKKAAEGAFDVPTRCQLS